MELKQATINERIQGAPVAHRYHFQYQPYDGSHAQLLCQMEFKIAFEQMDTSSIFR